MNSEMGAKHPGWHRKIRNVLTSQGGIAPNNQRHRVAMSRIRFAQWTLSLEGCRASKKAPSTQESVEQRERRIFGGRSLKARMASNWYEGAQ